MKRHLLGRCRPLVAVVCVSFVTFSTVDRAAAVETFGRKGRIRTAWTNSADVRLSLRENERATVVIRIELSVPPRTTQRRFPSNSSSPQEQIATLRSGWPIISTGNDRREAGNLVKFREEF